MCRPDVSVIIPTRNRSKLLRRAIDSVLSQTLDRLEVIIVDDASEDDTEQVVRSIGDGRIRYIRNHHRQGASESRNIGIRLAAGQFVSFLDSDDEWLPEKLETQMAVMRGCNRPEYTLVYGAVFVESGDAARVLRRVRPRRGKLPNESVGEYLFLHEGLMSTSTFMLSRDLAQQVMFSGWLRRHEDWDLCLRLEQLGVEFVYLETPLSVIHDDHDRDRLSLETGFRDSLQWIDSWREHLHPDAHDAFVSTTVARLAFASGSWLAGMKCLRRGMRNRNVPRKLLVKSLVRLLPKKFHDWLTPFVLRNELVQ